MKKAYVVAEIQVTNPQDYEAYRTQSTAAAAQYGGKFLVRGGAITALEGKIPYERIVINEFPDVEAAKRFYHSPEYQAARAKRIGAADFHMIIVEGAS
jgi:uncharacterized protein (DUF1330 family)